MSSRRQRSIPLGGRYRQVSLYLGFGHETLVGAVCLHYDDVIMTMLESQITSLTVVYSIVYTGVHQRKHQSSASLAFVREIHRGPVNFPHKWPVTRKMFPFDDVIMLLFLLKSMSLWLFCYCCHAFVVNKNSNRATMCQLNHFYLSYLSTKIL